jgi:hypothetical protein
MTNRQKAEKIIDNLNNRSIHIDFDDQIMEEIYQEIENVISSFDNNNISLYYIMKELAKYDVETILAIDGSNNMFLDLKTEAKSHLYLYEDGTIKGRYDYENIIDLTHDIDGIIISLCYEFKNGTYGRDYGQNGWFDLLKKLEIEI